MIFTFAQIDRAFEIALRKTIVGLGYYPDPVAFIGNPVGYQAAKQAIIDSGKQLIEVYGVGHLRDRGQLKQNNIIIDRVRVGKGSIGFSQPFFHEAYVDAQGKNMFRKVQVGEGTKSMTYEIRFVAYNTEYDRLINEIVDATFDNRAYVNGINPDLSKTADKFLVTQDSDQVDLSGDSFIERLWRYNVEDVILKQNQTITERISPILEMQLGLMVDTEEAGTIPLTEAE